MTFVTGALLTLVGLQAAAIVVLMVERARRVRGERALRESEGHFRRIADEAPMMIWTARPDTTLDYLNRTCTEFTGVALEQLLDHGWLDAVHPDDRASIIAIFMPACEARESFVLEYRIRRVDGSYRWLLDTGVPRRGPDGAFAGFIGCCVDITDRKDAEVRIRESRSALEASHREIQQLAGRLIESQDSERARVARDLHDDVSQQLAGLSIALSGLRHRMEELFVDQELKADLGAIHKRTSTLAQNVRHLSHDLHPTVLRHAGLTAALASYCAELERAHGVVLTCRAEGDFKDIPPEAALCLYRVAQEALRNVIAHAGAGRADVRLVRTGETAEISITDDGRGFDVARAHDRAKGLGLVSITERVRFAGGIVDIKAGTDKGTCLRARIPARTSAEFEHDSDAESGLRELSRS